MSGHTLAAFSPQELQPKQRFRVHCSQHLELHFAFTTSCGLFLSH